MLLSFRTDRSGQTVQTQIRLWSGFTPFAIPFASFGCITLRKRHLPSTFRVITKNFQVSEILGFLWFNINSAVQQHMPFTCRNFFLTASIFGLTKPHQEVVSMGFKNWFRFQQNKWANWFWFLKIFTQQMDSSRNQVRTETGLCTTKILKTFYFVLMKCNGKQNVMQTFQLHTEQHVFLNLIKTIRCFNKVKLKTNRQNGKMVRKSSKILCEPCDTNLYNVRIFILESYHENSIQ